MFPATTSLRQEEEKQQIAQMGIYKIHNTLRKKGTLQLPNHLGKKTKKRKLLKWTVKTFTILSERVTVEFPATRLLGQERSKFLKWVGIKFTTLSAKR